MHLIENYALGTGLKIGKPYINKKFMALPFDGDYISFQPYSKWDSKNYDYWHEVLKILSEAFNEKQIRIVQIGLESEPKVYGAYDYRGKSDFNQAAYVVDNSILHLGADSFAAHIASGEGKKVVALYSISYPSECGAYWTANKNKIEIEPPWEEGEKPSYSPVEVNKKINLIKPEKIAKAVCKLLKQKLNFPFKTLVVGENFGVKKVELIPEASASGINESLGVDSVIVRMDLHHDERVLSSQLQNSNCSIITRKPIEIGLLSSFRHRIKELIIVIDEETDVEYIKKLKLNCFKYFLITHLEKDKLEKIKLKYLDLGNLIERKKRTFDSIPEFKGKNKENIFFRSSAFTINNGMVYMSKDTSFNGTPVEDINNTPLVSISDTENSFEDYDHSIYYEKIA